MQISARRAELRTPAEQFGTCQPGKCRAGDPVAILKPQFTPSCPYRALVGQEKNALQRRKNREERIGRCGRGDPDFAELAKT